MLGRLSTFCAVSLLAAHAEALSQGSEVVTYNGMKATLVSETQCARILELRIDADEPSEYQGDRLALQRLIAGARMLLQRKCPILREINIAGHAKGTPIFGSTISDDSDWQLPPPSAAQFDARRSSVVRDATSCDTSTSDPLVGCWMQVYPSSFAGQILNIKANGAWFWDKPERLANGTFGHRGIRIDKYHMYGAGPYLEFIDQDAWRVSMTGPMFKDNCNVLRFGPYKPLGIDIFGPSDDQILIYMDPEWSITTNIYTEEESRYEYDTYAEDLALQSENDFDTGVDDAPRVSNCPDNFDADLREQELFLFAVSAIGEFRLPSLVMPGYARRLASTAGRIPRFAGLARALGAQAKSAAFRFPYHLKGRSRVLGRLSGRQANTDFVARNPAYIANLQSQGKRWQPAYAASHPVYDFNLTRASRNGEFVQVSTSKGPDSSPFFLRRSDVAGLNPNQIRDKYNLPSTPLYIRDVNVPANSRIRTGVAAGPRDTNFLGAQGSDYSGLGNGQQYEALNIRDLNFGNWSHIGPL